MNLRRVGDLLEFGAATGDVDLLRYNNDPQLEYYRNSIRDRKGVVQCFEAEKKEAYCSPPSQGGYSLRVNLWWTRRSDKASTGWELTMVIQSQAPMPTDTTHFPPSW